MRRRALLALVGTTAIAGCSTVSGLFGEEYVGLGGLDIENWDDEPHGVRVQVDAEGVTVLDRTLDTDAYADRTVDGGELPCVWRDTSGPYVVRARHESSEGWTELALDDGVDQAGLVEVSVRVGYPDGSDEVEVLRVHGDITDCRTTTADTSKENAF